MHTKNARVTSLIGAMAEEVLPASEQVSGMACKQGMELAEEFAGNPADMWWAWGLAQQDTFFLSLFFWLPDTRMTVEGCLGPLGPCSLPLQFGP